MDEREWPVVRTRRWPVAAAVLAAGAAALAVAIAGEALHAAWSLAVHAATAASPLLAGAALFSRLGTSKVLDHPLRRRLFTHIRLRPGTSPQALAEAEEAGWSTIIYHLRVLEDHGFVSGVRDGRHRRFFDRTSGRWANGRKRLLATILNPTTARVAFLARDEPGITQQCVGQRLQIAASSVNWHVRRLNRVGLVDRVPRGGKVSLQPGAAWVELESAGAVGLARQAAEGDRSPVIAPPVGGVGTAVHKALAPRP